MPTPRSATCSRKSPSRPASCGSSTATCASAPSCSASREPAGPSWHGGTKRRCPTSQPGRGSRGALPDRQGPRAADPRGRSRDAPGAASPAADHPGIGRADAGGETEIILVTNLPEDVSAIDCCAAYRGRWGIEGHFQVLTDLLNCEIPTLGYPARHCSASGCRPWPATPWRCSRGACGRSTAG